MDNRIRILVDPQGTYADPDLEDHGPTTQPQVPPTTPHHPTPPPLAQSPLG